MGYTKLWRQMLTSSINDCEVETRWAWVCLLAAADADGVVHGTPAALARVANLPLPAVEKALEEFQAPDPLSTSVEYEGRRLQRLEGNDWLILNHEKYRQMQSEERTRELTRERVKRYRERKRGSDGLGNGSETENNRGATQNNSKSEVRSQKSEGMKKETLCSEPQTDSELEDAVLRFQLKDGTDWGLSQKLVDELKEAYPGIDVVAEARKARVWLIANPVKRKTLRGMPKFLSNWVERANNRGTAAGQMAPDVALEFNATFDKLAGSGGADGN